jgi:hypothetical protein
VDARGTGAAFPGDRVPALRDLAGGTRRRRSRLALHASGFERHGGWRSHASLGRPPAFDPTRSAAPFRIDVFSGEAPVRATAVRTRSLLVLTGPGFESPRRLRFVERFLASADGAAVIAASIFLDIFRVFLISLDLFGGARD